MRDGLSVKLRGFRELDHTLGQLPKATAKRTLRTIGIAALEPIAAAMRSGAPRDQGDLIEGITVGTKLSRSQQRYKGFMGGPINKDMVVVHAGPGSHPQAVIQEIGSYKEPPQPYVTPAWEGGKQGALDYVTSNLGDVVMKAASRAAKKGKLG